MSASFDTKRLAALSLCALAALSTACVTAGEGQQIHAQLDALDSAEKADHAAAAADRQKMAEESASRARQLQDALDALNRAARKSGADLSVDLDKAKDDIAQLRGAIEVLQHRIDVIEAANVERDKKLDPLVAMVGARQKAAESAEHPTDKGAIYALALKKLDAGDTARARELLTDFLARFKGDALAPNAQYWLGETWYAEKHYSDALVEFEKVRKEYKGSEKYPDALLKIGLCFMNMGDCQNAGIFFDTVVADHRQSPAAKVAKEKAAECKRK